MTFFMCAVTSFSKHFITIEVKVTGRFRQVTVFFLGMGVIAVAMRQVRTTACVRDRLKMSAKTFANTEERALSTRPGMSPLLMRP